MDKGWNDGDYHGVALKEETKVEMYDHDCIGGHTRRCRPVDTIVETKYSDAYGNPITHPRDIERINGVIRREVPDER